MAWLTGLAKWEKAIVKADNDPVWCHDSGTASDWEMWYSIFTMPLQVTDEGTLYLFYIHYSFHYSLMTDYSDVGDQKLCVCIDSDSRYNVASLCM